MSNMFTSKKKVSWLVHNNTHTRDVLPLVPVKLLVGWYNRT